MNIVVQHIESGLYLGSNGAWVKLSEASVFTNPVQGISSCIHRAVRDVRLVYNAHSSGNERYVYPFGNDPAVRAERKKLRRFLAENRRLKRQKRLLMARIDILRAEAKDAKKQFPFKRKRLSKD